MSTGRRDARCAGQGSEKWLGVIANLDGRMIFEYFVYEDKLIQVYMKEAYYGQICCKRPLNLAHPKGDYILPSPERVFQWLCRKGSSFDVGSYKSSTMSYSLGAHQNRMLVLRIDHHINLSRHKRDGEIT